MIRYPHLRVFVATTAAEVPCRRFVSVDGSVPGALITWDHHVSGEDINLDAMPDVVSGDELDGVGTTMADTDALASVVAVLVGGKGNLPPFVREVLESASYWCDHLGPRPGAQGEASRLGRGLHNWVSMGLKRGQSFESLCKTVAHGPIPYLAVDDRPARRRVARLVEERRLRLEGPVAIADLRGRSYISPEYLYQRHDRAVMILVEEHPKGGNKYTIGVNPRVTHPEDLCPALRALAAAEYTHGPPALSPETAPGSENWGGRRTVFGSPWNYASRLGIEEVVGIVVRVLFGV